MKVKEFRTKKFRDVIKSIIESRNHYNDLEEAVRCNFDIYGNIKPIQVGSGMVHDCVAYYYTVTWSYPSTKIVTYNEYLIESRKYKLKSLNSKVMPKLYKINDIVLLQEHRNGSKQQIFQVIRQTNKQLFLQKRELKLSKDQEQQVINCKKIYFNESPEISKSELQIPIEIQDMILANCNYVTILKPDLKGNWCNKLYKISDNSTYVHYTIS